MVHFRLSLLSSAVFLFGLASAFSALGCDDNPSLPFQPGASSNLVVNGGFERPRISAYEYDSYSAGDFISGWSIDSGAVDLLSGRIWSPAEGAQSLDMDGSCGTGTIHQDIPTEARISYDLQFALSGNRNGPPVVKRLEVSWNDTVIDTAEFDTTGGSKRNPGWVHYAYTMIAASGTTRLRFRSLSPGCYGALLDDVTVKKTPSI